MKQHEYKNFEYNLNGDKNRKAIYYVCKCGGIKKTCGGILHYNKGFLITEEQKHVCVDTGKVIDMMTMQPFIKIFK